MTLWPQNHFYEINSTKYESYRTKKEKSAEKFIFPGQKQLCNVGGANSAPALKQVV